MPPRTRLSAASFRRRARPIRWLLLDVDGVLTDGRLLYGGGGEPWLAFDIKDGLALKLARLAGLEIGILSGRSSAALAQRAKALGIAAMIAGREDKGVAYREWLAGSGTRPEEVAYVGDDLLDLPILLHCGLGLAPADAAPEVRAVVHGVLEAAGGRGAVREAVRRILDARGEWAPLVARFASS
jgi:3-deoxy-D-manno-octulosonate 8-phosphate phosphatase (KDO 8-P phosphatase)